VGHLIGAANFCGVVVRSENDHGSMAQ
jgi:hypothetical protein